MKKIIKNQRRRNIRKTNPLFKLKESVSHRIRESLKNRGYTKRSKTSTYLCCSYEEFMIHLGPKPEGNIELDHICPCAQGKTEEEVIKLQRYANFQWLPAEENRTKSDNWTPKGEELCRTLLGREWIYR